MVRRRTRTTRSTTPSDDDIKRFAPPSRVDETQEAAEKERRRSGGGGGGSGGGDISTPTEEQIKQFAPSSKIESTIEAAQREARAGTGFAPTTQQPGQVQTDLGTERLPGTRERADLLSVPLGEDNIKRVSFLPPTAPTSILGQLRTSEQKFTDISTRLKEVGADTRGTGFIASALRSGRKGIERSGEVSSPIAQLTRATPTQAAATFAGVAAVPFIVPAVPAIAATTAIVEGARFGTAQVTLRSSTDFQKTILADTETQRQVNIVAKEAESRARSGINITETTKIPLGIVDTRVERVREFAIRDLFLERGLVGGKLEEAVAVSQASFVSRRAGFIIGVASAEISSEAIGKVLQIKAPTSNISAGKFRKIREVIATGRPVFKAGISEGFAGSVAEDRANLDPVSIPKALTFGAIGGATATTFSGLIGTAKTKLGRKLATGVAFGLDPAEPFGDAIAAASRVTTKGLAKTSTKFSRVITFTPSITTVSTVSTTPSTTQIRTQTPVTTQTPSLVPTPIFTPSTIPTTTLTTTTTPSTVSTSSSITIPTITTTPTTVITPATTTTTTSTSTNVPTIVPGLDIPFIPPLFPGGGGGSGRRLARTLRLPKSRFTPSLVAVALGIRGKRPQTLTGLGIRPITSDFGLAPKRRKSKKKKQRR